MHVKSREGAVPYCCKKKSRRAIYISESFNMERNMQINHGEGRGII